MMLGIGTKLVDLSRPKGPTTPPPPAVTWNLELENGLGFLALQKKKDLIIQEAEH